MNWLDSGHLSHSIECLSHDEAIQSEKLLLISRQKEIEYRNVNGQNFSGNEQRPNSSLRQIRHKQQLQNWNRFLSKKNFCSLIILLHLSPSLHAKQTKIKSNDFICYKNLIRTCLQKCSNKFYFC